MAFSYDNADKFGQAAALGGQGIGAAWQQARNETAANMPIPQALADYYQKVLAGADPVQLGLEARNHPELQQWLKQQLGGQAGPPMPALPPQVGPGQGPGYPGVYRHSDAPAPHTGQGGGLGAVSGANPVSGAAVMPNAGSPPPQHMNTAGQIPASPWELSRPAQSLSNIQSQSHSMAQSVMNPQPLSQVPGRPVDLPQSGQSAPMSGLSFAQAAPYMAQPMQAPNVNPAAAGAGIPQEQPGGGRFVARANFPAPQFRGGDTIARKDAPMFAQAAEAEAARRSREQIARTGMQGKQDNEQLKLAVQAAIADGKQRGVDAMTTLRGILGMEVEEGKNRRFAESEAGKMARNERTAEATEGAARTRAAVPKSDPRFSVLNNIMNAIKGLTAVTKWEAQPELRRQVDEQIRMYDELAGQLGVPLYSKPSGGTPKPAPKAAPKAAPAAAPAPGVAPGPSKLRVRKKATNEIGTIDAKDFDPAKYEKA